MYVNHNYVSNSGRQGWNGLGLQDSLDPVVIDYTKLTCSLPPSPPPSPHRNPQPQPTHTSTPLPSAPTPSSHNPPCLPSSQSPTSPDNLLRDQSVSGNNILHCGPRSQSTLINHHGDRDAALTVHTSSQTHTTHTHTCGHTQTYTYRHTGLHCTLIVCIRLHTDQPPTANSKRAKGKKNKKQKQRKNYNVKAKVC